MTDVWEEAYEVSRKPLSPSLEKQYIGAPQMEPQSVDEILTQRGNRYGKFSGHAELTQSLKATFSDNAVNLSLLTPSMQEALDMIFHKIGRIGNGDPFYDDSWVDIAGYAQLVVDELRGDPK